MNKAELQNRVKELETQLEDAETLLGTVADWIACEKHSDSPPYKSIDKVYAEVCKAIGREPKEAPGYPTMNIVELVRWLKIHRSRNLTSLHQLTEQLIDAERVKNHYQSHAQQLYRVLDVIHQKAHILPSDFVQDVSPYSPDDTIGIISAALGSRNYRREEAEKDTRRLIARSRMQQEKESK